MSNKQSIKNLENTLDQMGKELGMPDDDDVDAYSSDCGVCGWQGNIMDIIIKNDSMFCPNCNHEFVVRTE
jgi:hypothetical protein